MNKIIQDLLKYKDIILTTHITPDGDALGSLYALSNALKYFNIKHKIIVDSIKCSVPFKIKNSKIKKINETSLVVVVDACEKIRLPLIIQNSKISNFIFIDHHMPSKKIKNAKYFININASSAGEIIYVLISKYLKLKITKEIAKGIYTALITDTRSFKYARTTALSHKIAYHFIKEKLIKPELIHSSIYHKQTESYLKFIGHVLSMFSIYNKVAYIFVSKDVLEKYKIIEHQTKSCFNDLFSVQNINCVVFMYENTNHDNVIIKTTSKVNFSIFSKFDPKTSKYSCSFKTPRNYSIKKIVKTVAKCIK